MCVQAYGWSRTHTAPCCLSLCSHCVRCLFCLCVRAQTQGSVLRPLPLLVACGCSTSAATTDTSISLRLHSALDHWTSVLCGCSGALAVSQARFCGGAVSCSQYMVSGSMHTHLLLHQSAAATCASVLQRDLACAHTTSKLISNYMRVSKVFSNYHAPRVFRK